MSTSLMAQEQTPKTFKIVANDEWRAVDMSNPYPVTGSPLDLSRFVENVPVGTYGRVIASPEGFLAFEKRPTQPLRFSGCTLVGELALSAPTAPTINDKAQIEAYAERLKRQGYNMVRFHFLDHALTRNVEKDGDFDPAVVDRVDYLVKCLKDRGIYLYLDAATSWRAYSKGPHWEKDSKAPRLKQRIFTDESARKQWEDGTRKLLTHVNPYTGLSLAKDPIVAVLLFFNEQELESYNKPFPELLAPWQTFLKQKYQSLDKLKTAWKISDGSLDSATSFETIPLWEVNQVQRGDQRSLDLGAFMIQLECDLAKWYTERVRAMGYNGLVSQYDYYLNTFQTVPRSQMNVVSMHNYFAHATDFNRAGSKVTQESSLSDAANYFRKLASMRLNDRPFLVTEYGHVYWNRYRFEEGLVFGAYASLQNYSAFMEHSDAVVVRPREISPFDPGRDPIGRASQVVTNFLYQRRDVAPAKHLVDIKITPEDLHKAENLYSGIGNEQNYLALLTGYGLSYPATPAPHPMKTRQPDVTMSLNGNTRFNSTTGTNAVEDSLNGKFNAQILVQSLKAKGILPPENQTDISRGVFQSENGQILLDSPNRRFTVTSSRLEGLSFDALPAPATTGALTVLSASLPASVTAIALDDVSLKSSKRMLVIFATDARNSNSEYTDATQTTLVNTGTLPVLMRTGTIQLRLQRAGTAPLKAWAIGIDGKRQQEIPLRTNKDNLQITIDTKSLTAGPTPFFEIAEK